VCVCVCAQAHAHTNKIDKIFKCYLLVNAIFWYLET